MTIHQAVLNAIAKLPRGQVRTDLTTAARLMDWRKDPEGPCADTGATIIRFDQDDPRPRGSASFRERPAMPIMDRGGAVVK